MIATYIALEWLNTKVLSQMDLKPGLLRVAHKANVTLEWLVLRMINHVGLQMSFRNE
jgi:hypothetical protein